MNWAALADAFLNLRAEWQLLLLLVLFIWLLRLLDAVFLKDRLKQAYGLKPRRRFQLRSLVFSPFLHSNRSHLFHNTIPLLIYGGLVGLYGWEVFLLVTGVCILVEGTATWLLGEDGNHLGISGLIFGYFGFTLVNGIFAQDGAAMLLGVLTGFMGRRAFAMLFARGSTISTSGHLFGFAAGIFSYWLVNYLQM